MNAIIMFANIMKNDMLPQETVLTYMSIAMIFLCIVMYVAMYCHARELFTINGYRLSGSANKKKKAIKSKWTFMQRLFLVHFFTSQCNYKHKYKIIAVLNYCHMILSIVLLAVFFSSFDDYIFCRDWFFMSVCIQAPLILIRYQLPLYRPR
jgi:hypothetical protein